MYLNDLTSAQHNVDKLNKILADTFNHEVDLSEMTTDSLGRMLVATENKMMAIKESDLKYWENPQYNKLGLIQHQLKTYINEVAPTRTDGKKMKAKSESVVMEDDLEQAEVMLAAQELVDELQKMVEDIAEMQVQKLMPIVDAMKEQVGFEQAEAYNNAVDSALGGLLDQSKSAKDAVENATLSARGEAPAQPAPTDMAMDAPADPEADMAVDTDMGDDFDADDAAAGDENPIGRELKGESAIADLEGRALSEKKFLESKDKLFKMVESGKMTQEHFINIISQLDEKDPYMGQDYQKFYKNQSPKINQMKTLPNTPPPSVGFDRVPPRAAPDMPAMDNPPMGDPLKGGPPPTGPGGDQALPKPKPPRPSAPPLAIDPRKTPNAGPDPRIRPGDRGFTPGEQEPEDRLKKDRGFTPGVQEPEDRLKKDRGFTPGEQVPPADEIRPGDRGFTPGKDGAVRPLPAKPSPGKPKKPKVPPSKPAPDPMPRPKFPPRIPDTPTAPRRVSPSDRDEPTIYMAKSARNRRRRKGSQEA